MIYVQLSNTIGWYGNLFDTITAKKSDHAALGLEKVNFISNIHIIWSYGYVTFNLVRIYQKKHYTYCSRHLVMLSHGSKVVFETIEIKTKHLNSFNGFL